MSDTFTWLHFSDLHWGAEKTKNYWPKVEEALFSDIQKLSGKNELTVDAVFFTGDMVNHGSEYDEFNLWLKRLEEIFKGQEKKPLFLPVPGNHDLVRPEFWKDGADLKDSVDLIKTHWDDPDREDLRNRIWQKDETSGTWKVFQKTFENYTAWLNNPGRPFPLPDNYTPGLLPGDFSCSIPMGGGNKIGIIGLNSSFLQLGAGNYEGRLDLHISQLRAVCGDHYTDWFKDHSLSFLMTHHPVAGFQKMDIANLLKR